jgi:hypothetical protein
MPKRQRIDEKGVQEAKKIGLIPEGVGHSCPALV